jgi:hypothetical protein
LYQQVPQKQMMILVLFDLPWNSAAWDSIRRDLQRSSQNGVSGSSARGKVKKNCVARQRVSRRILIGVGYFDGAGAAGAGMAGAGAGADAGDAGAGTAGADFDVFENCCNTELPVDPTAEFWCMVNAMDVSMNMMAHQVVALERKVAAPRGPNAVWLPAPPKAPARSAASPLCSMITTIKSAQMMMCNVTSIKYTFQPSASRPNPTANEIAHFTSFGISFPLLSEIHNGGKGVRI